MVPWSTVEYPLSTPEHAVSTREGALARPLAGGGTSGRSDAWRVRPCDRMRAAASRQAVHAPEHSLWRRRTRQRVRPSCATQRRQSRRRCVRGGSSPGADAAGLGAVPLQMWEGCGQSWCRCGRGRARSWCRCGRGGRSPGADVAAVGPVRLKLRRPRLWRVDLRRYAHVAVHAKKAERGVLLGRLNIFIVLPQATRLAHTAAAALRCARQTGCDEHPPERQRTARGGRAGDVSASASASTFRRTSTVGRCPLHLGYTQACCLRCAQLVVAFGISPLLDSFGSDGVSTARGACSPGLATRSRRACNPQPTRVEVLAAAVRRVAECAPFVADRLRARHGRLLSAGGCSCVRARPRSARESDPCSSGGGFAGLGLSAEG